MNPEWIGCAPHNFRAGRPGGFRPELIVIHVIVGTLLSADRWFNNPSASVSAHYGVGRDGSVHQFVAETDTAFHAGIVVNPVCKLVVAQPNVNPNYYSIGIEHEGQPEDAWTPEQAEASSALIAEIANRWNIPIDDQHVVAHHDIRASKTCPGDQQKVDALIVGAQAAAARGLLVASSQPAPVGNVPAAGPELPPLPVVPSPGEIRIITTVRVRKGAPSTTAPIVNVLEPNALFRPIGVVTGEVIQGNAKWYRDADENFVWAGGTDAPDPKS